MTPSSAVCGSTPKAIRPGFRQPLRSWPNDSTNTKFSLNLSNCRKTHRSGYQLRKVDHRVRAR